MRKSVQTFSFLVAGLQPPDYVIQALDRFHPNVRLVWNTSYERWQLVERGLLDGRWHHVMLLHGPDGEFLMPSLANTVWRLGDIDVRTHTYWERKRFLEGAEDEERQEYLQEQSDKKIREISEEAVDRLWHDEGKRVVAAVPRGE